MNLMVSTHIGPLVYWEEGPSDKEGRKVRKGREGWTIEAPGGVPIEKFYLIEKKRGRRPHQADHGTSWNPLSIEEKEKARRVREEC